VNANGNASGSVGGSGMECRPDPRCGRRVAMPAAAAALERQGWLGRRRREAGLRARRLA
jgi:hypothetical protein